MRAVLRNRNRKPIVFVALLLFATTGTALGQSSDWTQWGGAHRDFKSDAKGLAASWPANGPRRVWQRELGEGYSGIAAERGVLFTMYRKGEENPSMWFRSRSMLSR